MVRLLFDIVMELRQGHYFNALGSNDAIEARTVTRTIETDNVAKQ